MVSGGYLRRSSRLRRSSAHSIRGDVQERRTVVLPKPLPRELRHLLRGDRAISIHLLVDERGITEVRGEHGELVRAFTRRLHGGDEGCFDECYGSLDLVTR